MTLLKDAVEEKKLDVRLLERNIERGVIAQKVALAAIANLPDDAANADWVSLESFSQDLTSGVHRDPAVSGSGGH